MCARTYVRAFMDFFSCLFVCLSLRTLVYLCACIFVLSSVRACVRGFSRVRVILFVSVCMCVRTCTCVLACMFVIVSSCVRTQTARTYTLSFTHIHPHLSLTNAHVFKSLVRLRAEDPSGGIESLGQKQDPYESFVQSLSPMYG